MERTISVEEKIKRAEEIYARRQAGNQRKTATVSINNRNKKDIKLLKKIAKQVVVSLIVYLAIYVIQNNNYIFSEDFINKANEILSYDTNFEQIYQSIKQGIEKNINEFRNQNNADGAIGGAEENIIDDKSTEDNEVEEVEENSSESQQINEQGTEQDNTSEVEAKEELTQEEQDIADIKATTTFIKPVEGTISSKFGQREPTTSTVPKNHTGTDIAANLGAKIKSSTDGEVVLVSEEGDYGKHIKVQIGEVSIIYAHCNSIYVKQGDIITQGQEIAEVGSTGNSTGPHLHFEIRIHERTADPEKILEL